MLDFTSFYVLTFRRIEENEEKGAGRFGKDGIAL